MQHLREPMRISDIETALVDMVPAAQAARMWHQRHGSAFGTERERAAHAVRMVIRRANPVVVSGGRGRSWMADTVLQFVPLNCRMCGTEFLASRPNQFACSGTCGSRAARREPEPEDPEVEAARVIAQALRGLPDRAARNRVLAFVRALV